MTGECRRRDGHAGRSGRTERGRRRTRARVRGGGGQGRRRRGRAGARGALRSSAARCARRPLLEMYGHAPTVHTHRTEHGHWPTPWTIHCAETVEELGVARESLAQPQLIGAMVELPGLKPDLLFVTHTRCSAEAVRRAYQSACDAWESDRLTIVQAGAPTAGWDGEGDREELAIAAQIGAVREVQRTLALTPVTAAACECFLRVFER